MATESRHHRRRGEAASRTATNARVRFSERDLKDFSAASHDRNPIHLDPSYARRTPYGQPVVFGVLAVLRCLEHLGDDPDRRIRRLEAEFSNPLFVDVDYDVRVIELDIGKAAVELCEGDLVLLKLRVFFQTAGRRQPQKLTNEAPPCSPGSVEKIRLRDVPSDYEDQQLLAAPSLTGVYQVGSAERSDTRRNALWAKHGKSHHRDVLMLSSYVVGMELPGRRSLLFKLSLDFEGSDDTSHSRLSYEADARHYDPTYGLLEIDLRVLGARGTLASGKISAFVRRRLAPPEASRIRAHLKTPAGSLHGRVALITGGSRGLGAALVQALALQGCDVILNFLSSVEEAEALQRQLTDTPSTVTLRQGDAGNSTWCSETRKWIFDSYGRLDLLICNACTPPLALGTSASGLARMRAYIDHNLALVTMPMAAFLDALEASEGTLVLVSSSIVESATQQWPQYKSMKLAAEAALQDAASHLPKVGFWVVRPPGLLTDMSNTPSRCVAALAPELVATRLVDALAGEAHAGRVQILSDFRAEGTSVKRPHDNAPATRRSEKIMLAATFTAKPLLPVIEFWNRELGWDLAAELAPYNQLYQQLLDPNSSLSVNPSGLNVIFLRFEDWLRERSDTKLAQAQSFLNHALRDFSHALEAYAQRPHCHTLLIVCPESPSYRGDCEWRRMFGRLRRKLSRAVATLSGVDVLSAEDDHAIYNVMEDFHDPISEEIGHIPFTSQYYSFLGTLVIRRFHNLRAKPYKVLVVDCDNTLWRGVCGEVGAKEVKVDAAAKILQRFLMEQKRQGMLLCLCSKNNAQDVERVFQTHPRMLLKPGDILDSRINWQPKSENLKSLADTLKLGLDSFVFMDDNVVECAEVSAECPQVLTLHLPSAVAELKQLLNHTWIFDHFEPTDEDRKRTELYRAEWQRRQLEATGGDFRAFLAGLNLEVDIEVASRKDFPRIAQLTQRTNQFNFTTIRRSERDVAALAEGSACECRVVRVRDRFGDYGLVGLITSAQQDDGLAVESFMLSCRVLGRGVEHRMMASLGELAGERSLASVTVPFTETSSNRPAKLFLEQLVISAAGRVGRDHKWWFAAEQLRQVRYDPQSAQVNQSDEKWPAPVTAGGEAYSPVANTSSLWRRIAMDLSDLRVLENRVRRGRSLKAEVSGDQRSRPAAAHSAGEVGFAQLVEELKTLFAETLDLELDAVDAEAALETYVTDSLDNVTLTVELKKRFPDIPITILFEHRSLRSLAAYLMNEHAGSLSSKYRDSIALPAAAAQGKRVSESKPSVRSEQTSSNGLRAIHRTGKTGDIAIIGINGKYPQARTLSEFWENLLAGRSCISEIPEDRWEVDAFFDAEPTADRSYCKRGGFIDDVDRFDAGFFHISPREAELMDPQQRLFLEVVWGLLEDAGYTRETIERDTGVFIGSNANDYALYANTLALQGISAYRNADYFQIPNRISYFFDFRGPSLCLDTACSSSGTAVYLACQSLKNGQCRAAIAGGINLFLHPSRFIQYSQMQMLSPTGRCSPFGAHANGTVFGEGVGALLLKPLANAERDGDHIYAVIKGCAINSGGKTNGFTVPNPQAHAAVVSQALREAEVDPATITYVEAHGTGTPLGDPIEIRGLTMAFEQNYAREDAGTQFCAIGSVKANIGHLEAGAAIAGIIKIAMQMNQSILVPSLNARNPNPSIPFATSPFRVQQEVERWARLTREADGHTTTYPRRAGLSSFGAGGSNAHVILEEYIAEAAPEPGEPHPALILLSARKRETLKTYASRLAAFLRRSSSQASGSRAARLTDIAFTLRVGREQLDERLALVVSSVDELIDKLAGWATSSEEGLAGTGSTLEKVYWGNAKTDKHSELPLDGPEQNAFVATLIEKQSLVELAQLWAHGVGIDWPLLPTVDDQKSDLTHFPRRISLPSYPFAGDRFWLPGEPNLKLAQVRDGLASGFHPLLDGIDAALSCGPGIVFYKRLVAQKPIVRDHVVRSQALLPGVGFLEMVCAALKRMGIDAPYRLGDVVWSHPLVIEDQPKEILVSIKAQETGELSYEVGSRESLPRITYASGTVRQCERSSETGPEHIAIDSIKGRCPQALGQETIYQQFRSTGIDYGPYFRSLEGVHCNGNEALGIVALPAPFQHELEHYTLHPSLLDAALQTALIANQGATTALPFSVKEVEILHPLGSSAYAFARRIGLQRFDVCMLDQNGLVCVRFNDLCLRPLRDPLERFFYTPRWKPCPLPKHAGIEPAGHAEHVVIIYSDESLALADMLAAHHASANVYRILLGTKDHRSDQFAWEVATEMPQALAQCLAPLKNIDRIYFLGGIRTGSEDVDDLEALDRSQERGVLSLFRTLKSLNRRGLTEQPVDLFIITNDVFSVMPQARTQPHSAGLLGLGKVIAKEFPRLQVRCLDISLAGLPPTPSEAEAQTLLRAILAEPAHCESEVVIREGQRYVQTLEPTHVPAVSELPYRKGGVYLILGGAGGLGFEFSRYLADTVQARLIWVGRSQLDASKHEKITQIESRGGEVLYLQADATDPASMREAVHQAKEKFGAIHGAVHSAIVLSDRTLANMSELEFNAAFAPKVKGSAVLYKVLKDEPLDFLLFFSSANSFMASMGQANYVAGCCFKDALGRRLNQIAGFPSKVINWGYWGTTGIVSGKDYQRRITAQGHRSIHPNEGMDAIGRVLSAPFGQAVAMNAHNEALIGMGVDLTAQVRLYPEEIPSLVQEIVAHEDAPALDRQCVRRFRQGFEQLEQLGRSCLVAALRRMGILFEPQERYDPVELKATLGITEAYFRLFDTLLDLLIDAGVLVRVGGELLSTDKLRDPAFSNQPAYLETRKNSLAQSFPEVAERIPLLAACLGSLPEMLTGNKGHMEVIFPGGSLALVEGIYAGNDITDHFNRRLAQLVADYVRRRLEVRPNTSIKILEVGAGTGGSSAHVLEAMRGFDSSRIRYFYTDISKKFIQHGEEAYGRRYPFTEFKRFDMEDDPEQQGFERDSIDLVFGTNCVHATRNITATLHRIKRLLKTNGILLLNEFTQRLDYNTLTFGLTSGWWLFEDDAFRIQGAPLLERSQWRHLLAGNGFRKLHLFELADVAGEDVGQCLIIGESDGRAISEQPVAPDEMLEAPAAAHHKDAATAVGSASVAIPESSPPGNHLSIATASTPHQCVPDDHLREGAVAYIKRVFSEVVKLNPSDIDSESTFDKYGVDSLMALGIVQRFEKDFGKLRATLLFEYSTVDALTDYFLEGYREALARRFGVGEERSKQQSMPAERAAAPTTTRDTLCAVQVEAGLQASVSARSAEVETMRPRSVAHEPSQLKTENVLRSRASAFEDEAIAIIGVAGRYPMADTLEELWDNLKSGRNCVTEIPPARWDAEAHYRADADASERSHSKWGGFINDVDKFDALFFNISPKDAQSMDPQERLFLETAWHAIEGAGYTRRRLDGVQKRHASGIGVFVGCMYQQYPFVTSNHDAGALLSSSSYWSIANRVSHFFNFNGPSLAVDSACSSSLTALHLACASIKRGECIMAVAGGVNLNLHPSKYLRLQQQGMLASTAQSKSLGDGDGLVPGEGVGAVLLKPLSLAIRDRDIVHGVIKSTVVNHGGRTSGFTVPNPNAQADLIANSLEQAGVDPRTINYVEVAANGSALGDAIEIAGLTKAFQRFTLDRQFCAIGAVKSNLGHLEAASGMAQLTKILLQLKHELLVPSINAEPLNPNLQLDSTPFYVQQRLSHWERIRIPDQGQLVEMPRRATISSFGAGGSNAHILVEEYQSPESEPAVETPEAPQLVVLSARTEETLKDYARRLLAFLQDRTTTATPLAIEKESLHSLCEDLLATSADILHVAKDDIDIERDLDEYGFEASHYTVLAHRLRDRYGIELSGRTLFDTRSLERIAKYLVSHHRPALEACLGANVHAVTSTPKTPTLTDIAYTLQTGREPMRERLAVVVSSTIALVDKLDEYCRGAVDIENLQHARVSSKTAALIFDDVEGREYLDSIIRNRKLNKLAQLWTSGVDIDWEQLHVTDVPKRVQLPTYPFAKHRCWIEESSPIALTKAIKAIQLSDASERRPDPANYRNTAEPISVRLHGANSAPIASGQILDRMKTDIAQLVSNLLQVDEREIDFDEALRAYGFDSINLTMLAQRISQRFDLDVTASLFFGCPSVAACAEELWAADKNSFTQYYEGKTRQRSTTAEVVEPLLPPVTKAATVIKVSAQTRDSAISQSFPIAIVGMSGRMPQSNSMEQFWGHLIAGRELITEVPKDRWEWQKHYGDPNGTGNKTWVKWGGFLTDVDKFDSLFFGISPREAQLMDPRQRLLLETVWSTIENAGYSPGEFAGSNTGLFVGVGNNDYSEVLRAANVELTAHASTGLMVNSILASRISYLLDLRGPSELVDTACSSSTVAMHRAIRAIRSGECDAAIVGGVNVLLDPQGFVILNKTGVLSTDGKVRLFSEGASGYVRGEGVGAVLLKPLQKAVSDRDYIYAVIRGSALNHDGKSYSLTAPNPKAQAEVILKAYQEAAIDPGTVSYIEAQGTGSPLADPVEIDAFKIAFKTLYEKWEIGNGKPVCGIGYLKPNIGHLECASGIAALLKLLWAFKTREIPVVKNVDEQAVKKHLRDSPFYIVNSNQPWESRPDRDGKLAPRRAGLHSFGFGGVNAHVVLEEYPRDGEGRA